MGHQVNFYLTHSDTECLEKVLRGVTPLMLLHSISHTSEPRVLDSSNFKENDQPWLYYFLVLPEDLERVVMRHVPAQGYWTVDVIKSPVVEFNRCFTRGRLLRRGRLYYVDRYYGSDDALLDKSEAFRKWAKSLLATTKKSLKKQGLDYLGSDAAHLLADGAVDFSD